MDGCFFMQRLPQHCLRYMLGWAFTSEAEIDNKTVKYPAATKTAQKAKKAKV